MYNSDFTWSDLAAVISSYAQVTIQQLERGLEAYNKWQSYRAGLTNAAVASAVGKSEADIVTMDAAFAALKEIYDFATNVAAPAAGDRFYSLRKFS